MNFGVPDVVVASNMVLKNPESEAWEKASPSGAIVWTAKFREALVRAIHYNDTMIALRRLHGPLSSMSKEELARWTMHVRNGHLPYSKRCKTCVAARATGHQHRRIEAPSCYVMSLDVAGPFRKKGQNPDGSDYRYMLVASYTMPVLEGRKCQPGDEIVNERDDGRGVGPIHPQEIQSFHQAVSQNPQEIQSFHQAVSQNPQEIQSFHQAVSQNPQEIQSFHQAVSQNPQEIQSFHQAVSQNPQEIQSFHQAVSQNPQEIQSFHQAVSQNPQEIQSFHQAVSQNPQEIQSFHQAVSQNPQVIPQMSLIVYPHHLAWVICLSRRRVSPWMH